MMEEEGINPPNVRFMMYLEPLGGLPDSSNCSGCDTSWLVMTTCGIGCSAFRTFSPSQAPTCRWIYFQSEVLASDKIGLGVGGGQGRGGEDRRWAYVRIWSSSHTDA